MHGSRKLLPGISNPFIFICFLTILREADDRRSTGAPGAVANTAFAPAYDDEGRDRLAMPSDLWTLA